MDHQTLDVLTFLATIVIPLGAAIFALCKALYKLVKWRKERKRKKLVEAIQDEIRKSSEPKL